MKKLILISVWIFLTTTLPNVTAQETEAWRDDLNYLIQRIEIMHPDPYAFFPKERFYALRDKLNQEIPFLSDVEIVLSLSELLAALQDGHTQWAFQHSDPQWLQQTFHLLPVIQYAFKDGIYIMAGLQQYQSLVGLKVIQIGEMPINDVISKIGRLWSHDNPSGEKKFLYYSLAIPEMLKKVGAANDVSEIKMVLQDDQNKSITVSLAPVDLFSMAPFFGASWYPQTGNGLVSMNQTAENPLPLWLRNQQKNFWFEFIPEDKIMVLQINSLNFPHRDSAGNAPFGQLCAEFFEALDQSKSEKLVIDIRANTGGNHVEQPLLEGILARPHLNTPHRLFLITGRVTYSAAVHLTTVLRRHTNITLVGEPPSGRPNHYGARRVFSLPNHPRIQFQCSIDYYQDSEPFDFNIIHAPDIRVEMSAADYRHNIDPAMLAVKNYDRIIKQVNEMMLKLDQAYRSNGISRIKEIYHSEKERLRESGYNQEKFFTKFYSTYLVKNKKNPADLSDYLALAVSECPESIDLHYYFANQLESERQLKEAEQMYLRCLELNPDHHYAKMKLGLMRLDK